MIRLISKLYKFSSDYYRPCHFKITASSLQESACALNVYIDCFRRYGHHYAKLPLHFLTNGPKFQIRIDHWIYKFGQNWAIEGSDLLFGQVCLRYRRADQRKESRGDKFVHNLRAFPFPWKESRGIAEEGGQKHSNLLGAGVKLKRGSLLFCGEQTKQSNEERRA